MERNGEMQDSKSISTVGVLRGLHRQIRHPQEKQSTEKTVSGSMSAMRTGREPIRSELFCGAIWPSSPMRN